MDTQNLEQKLSKIGTPQCRVWADALFQRHLPVSLYLKARYVRTAKYKNYKEANRELIRLNKDLTWVDGNSIVWDKQKIESAAILYSGYCKASYDRTYKANSDVRTAANPVRTYVRKMRIPEHFKPTWENLSDEEVFGLCKRTFTEKWWRRKLTRISERATETVLREIGYVKKSSGAYSSNYALNKTKYRRKRNKAWTEAMSVVSKLGTVLPLSDVVASSLANPTNRRHDLMTRIRGTEEVAKKMGLSCLFLTMTCPSRYHAYLGNSGRPNPKFDKSSVTDAMKYLNTTWRQIRADYGKAKIQIAGLRVCEPHHDGTPHFHFVIFISESDKSQFLEIFRKHNFKTDGDEQGAQKHRVDCEEIDMENGSATGYIAKYISKNIDGSNVGEDFETGTDASDTSERVLAWSSLWGIRQFQPLGSVSATVYREFRRLPSELTGKNAEAAEKARFAADNGDFESFIEAMGGLFVKRADAPFRAFHIVREKLSVFGEEIKKLIGLIASNSGDVIQTRFEEWAIKPTSMLVTLEAAQPPPLEYWQ